MEEKKFEIVAKQGGADLEQYITKVKLITKQAENITTDDNDDEEQSNQQQTQHLYQTLQALQYIKSINIPSIEDLQDKLTNLPPSRHKKTLIFDLDETLVHCVEDLQTADPDIVLPITFPNGDTV